MYDNLSRVIEVDIDEILPNRFQPRIQFDEEEILELSDSIKEHGVIQPLVVRTIGDKYEIIAGERRYKASVLAGKETVPVIVKNLNDKDSAEIALIENIQRKNLTPIEEALSYKKILDMGYITQENLATKLGKSQSAVANKIRLLNLSDEVQEALLENKISERHARSLLKLSTSKQQNDMLNRIITERLTVRKADEEIEKIKNVLSEEINNDTEKIIEKGEIEMNNNMFGMPNVPQNPQPNFDIFGSSSPVGESIQNQVPQTPSFDIFTENTLSTQPMEEVAPSTSIYDAPQSEMVSAPEAPSMPTMEVPSMPMFKIEPQSMEEVAPSTSIYDEPQPAMVSASEAPSMPTMEVPSMPMFKIEPQSMEEVAPSTSIYDAPQPKIVSASEAPSMPTMEVPSMPMFKIEPQPMKEVVPSTSIYDAPQPAMVSVPEVPVTAPIVESSVIENKQMAQEVENLFAFGDANLTSAAPVSTNTIEPISSVPEFKMPDPIIITDFSKQYDPIMPETTELMSPVVNFKEVISAIRECSNKIEKYGYKIDVEEYDLANLYQVVFKIEK